MHVLVVSVSTMVRAILVWILIPEVEREAGEKRMLDRAVRNGEIFEVEE